MAKNQKAKKARVVIQHGPIMVSGLTKFCPVVFGVVEQGADDPDLIDQLEHILFTRSSDYTPKWNESIGSGNLRSETTLCNGERIPLDGFNVEEGWALNPGEGNDVCAFIDVTEVTPLRDYQLTRVRGYLSQKRYTSDTGIAKMIDEVPRAIVYAADCCKAFADDNGMEICDWCGLDEMSGLGFPFHEYMGEEFIRFQFFKGAPDLKAKVPDGFTLLRCLVDSVDPLLHIYRTLQEPYVSEWRNSGTIFACDDEYVAWWLKDGKAEVVDSAFEWEARSIPCKNHIKETASQKAMNDFERFMAAAND